MAAPNYTPKYDLSDSWQHRWTLITGSQNHWQDDIETLVLNNVFFFDDGYFDKSFERKCSYPDWVNDIEIEVSPNGIQLSLADVGPITAVLFPSSLYLLSSKPSWYEMHPIETLKLESQIKFKTKFWQGDCRELLQNVAKRIGDYIEKQFSDGIRQGRIVVFGLGTDAFEDVKQIPFEQFNSSFNLNIQGNKIWFPSRGLTLEGIKVFIKGSDLPEVGYGKSFQGDDDLLLNEMRQLLEQKVVTSIRDAAKQVEPRARRKTGTKSDSVIERLQRAFGSKYPKFMKQ